MAKITKKEVKKSETKTLGFVNWSLMDKKGNMVFRADKGFPIRTSKEYPVNDDEQWLIDHATSKGGSVTLTFQVTVNVCDSKTIARKRPAATAFKG